MKTKSLNVATSSLNVVTPTSVEAVRKTEPLKKIYILAESFLSMSERTLAEFAKKFAEDPHYAFSWGQTAVVASAQQHVGKMLNQYVAKVQANKPGFSNDEIAATVVREIREELVRKARWPEHSTSPISNIVSIARTAALAEFVARMEEV